MPEAEFKIYKSFLCCETSKIGVKSNRSSFLAPAERALTPAGVNPEGVSCYSFSFKISKRTFTITETSNPPWI